jgi:hypothetical protein
MAGMNVIDRNGNPVLVDDSNVRVTGQGSFGYNPQAPDAGASYFDKYRTQYGSMADQYRGITGQNIDRGQIDKDIVQGQQSRNEMLGALSMLSQRAQTGETPATQQLRQQQAQNMASLRGSGLSARGGLAARAAASRAGQIGAGRGQQANAVGMSALQAAEMDRARQQYMQQATALRAADLQRRGLSAEEAFRQANLNQDAYMLGQNTALGYEGLGQGEFGQQVGTKVKQIGRGFGAAGVGAQNQFNNENRGIQGGAAGLTGALGGLSELTKDSGGGQQKSDPYGKKYW